MLEILIDYRESKLKDLFDKHIFKDKKLTPLITYENLDVGDIIIKKDEKTVLIFERKSIPDLYSSINDGRYKEQKIRLLNNYPLKNIVYIIEEANTQGTYNKLSSYPNGIGPGLNPLDQTQTGLYVTGNFQDGNQKDILSKFGIILDGKYRENEFDSGVYNYIEKYSKSNGNSSNGLYCYNFCLNTNPYDFQPSGAMNLSKFKNIELELTTYVPPLDASAQTFNICSDGEIIGSNKESWIIYDYTFDLTLFEEKYNILKFTSGNAALVYSR